MIAFENWPRWFRQMWPGGQQRWAVLRGYRALASDHPLILADIALRNGLFAPALNITSEFDAGVAEGRRRAALDIFKLAQADINKLYDQATRNNGADNDQVRR